MDEPHFNHLCKEAVKTAKELSDELTEKLDIEIEKSYVPSSMTPAEMLEYLLKLVKKEYDRQHNRDAR